MTAVHSQETPRHAQATEQREQIKRVKLKIERVILTFCAAHEFFCITELADAVRAVVPHTSPDSPSRILRILRQRKVLDYRVVSRTGSRYQVLDRKLF